MLTWCGWKLTGIWWWVRQDTMGRMRSSWVTIEAKGSTFQCIIVSARPVPTCSKLDRVSGLVLCTQRSEWNSKWDVTRLPWVENVLQYLEMNPRVPGTNGTNTVMSGQLDLVNTRNADRLQQNFPSK